MPTRNDNMLCHAWRVARRRELLWLMSSAAIVTMLICSRGSSATMPAPTTGQTGFHPAARRSRSRRQAPVEAAASYSRFSSELQDEASIESQQAACQAAAQRDGKAIAPLFQFSDKAVSGTKLDRDGLNQLLAAAEAGQFNTLYFFSLSRLARESVISMPILKRLVYLFGVRVISVTEGVDSERDGWEMMAQILSMQHERYVKELSANTFRGQEANIAKGFSNGDLCFGYTSVPVPGTELTRRGRHARPRMQYAIDPTTAPWVGRIFHWFVVERQSLRWITRELNRLGAPKDHRATTKPWKHTYLPRLLSNPKYIGIWPWGQKQNVRDPSTGDIRQADRDPEKADKWVRHFPELRLIDDETFASAGKLLQENAARHAHRHAEDGTFSHDQAGPATSPSHLLSGLIVCGHCQRNFHVGGSNGKRLFCPGYHQGVCPCQTTLNRRVAEDLILAQISQRILVNPVWLEFVVACTKESWAQRQRTIPNELRDTENALAEIGRKIGRLIDSLEDQTTPDPDLQQRLHERRTERQRLEAKLASLRSKEDRLPQEPTATWVQEKILQLRDVLASPTPAAGVALRELVGGRIVVNEIRREGRQRYYLRGTFQIHQQQVLNLLELPVEPEALAEFCEDELITIDFVAPNPLDAKAEQAKVLWDEGFLGQEIAHQMGCSKSQITKLLKHWSTLYGEALPDGRARRSQLNHQHVVPPQYQAIAEEVMCLVNAGRLLQDIAETLGCDRNTVTKAIKFWHTSQGLPAPDGRTRRKGLPNKVSRPRRRDEDQNGAADIA